MQNRAEWDGQCSFQRRSLYSSGWMLGKRFKAAWHSYNCGAGNGSNAAVFPKLNGIKFELVTENQRKRIHLHFHILFGYHFVRLAKLFNSTRGIERYLAFRFTARTCPSTDYYASATHTLLITIRLSITPNPAIAPIDVATQLLRCSNAASSRPPTPESIHMLQSRSSIASIHIYISYCAFLCAYNVAQFTQLVNRYS